jgi:hypothetical protein
MTLEEPLDKRLFNCEYDDIEILGKLMTRGEEWRRIGTALHIQNGAMFGIVYAQLRPLLPGPAPVQGLIFGLAEHLVSWPATALIDRYHPARKEMPKLFGNRAAFAQATIRHAVFGLVLGVLEGALNDRTANEPPEIPVSMNGHGDIEHSAAGASV